jgi:accessory gene regulator B
MDLLSKMTDSVTNKIYQVLSKGQDLTRLEDIKLEFGIRIWMTNLSKLVLFLPLALVFNTVIESIIAISGFMFLRKHAFGIHAGSAISCFTLTSATMILGVWALKAISVDPLILMIIALMSLICIFKYAPQETKKTKMYLDKSYLRNKYLATLKVLVIIMGCMLFGFNGFSKYLIYGVFVETITVLPITYKLLKKAIL